MGDVEKKFRENRTGRVFDTLKAAKKACKCSYVDRVWLRDGQVIGRCTLYAYGDTCCTVRAADENIEWMLARGEARL